VPNCFSKPSRSRVRVGIAITPALRTRDQIFCLRLVSLSSSGHRFSDVNLDDPNFERHGIHDFVAYGRSKTANVLFAVEFDRRHKPAACARRGSSGGIQTDSRDMAPGALDALAKQLTDEAQARSDRHSHSEIPQGGRRAWGQRGRACGGCGGSLLRGLPRRRLVDAGPNSAAAYAPMRSIGTRESAVGQRARRWWERF